MSEEKNGLEGAQAGQETLMNVTVDPFKASPVYVSSISVGKKFDHPMLFLSFFSGLPISLGPNPQDTQVYSTLVASFALEPNHVRFLYQNLRDFLKALGEEV